MSLDLDRIKAALSHAVYGRRFEEAHFADGWNANSRWVLATVLNSAPALIAEVERLRLRRDALIECNNLFEQQARDARAAHKANGKILEAVQLALVRSEDEVERLERELATAKAEGAASEEDDELRIFREMRHKERNGLL